MPTVNKLIEGSFKRIGLFSEDQPLGNGKTTEGLFYLSALMDEFANSPERIAYYSTVQFNLVPGQREYTFSKQLGADVNSQRIVELKFVNIENNDVIYPVEITEDALFLNRSRTDTQTCLPSKCYLQNKVGTSTLVFFTLPDIAYECTVKAKFVLDHPTLNSELDEVPESYYLFLELALGRSLKGIYRGAIWTQDHEREYMAKLNNVTQASDTDMVSDAGSALGLRYTNRRDFYYRG